MPAARVVQFTSRGEAQFFEDLANGENKVTVRAPASLAGDYAVQLPTALAAGTRLVQISSSGQLSLIADGTVGQLLQTDGAGVYSFATPVLSVSLQQAYNAGQTIAVNGTQKVQITQANNIATLLLQKTGTGAGRHVEILNAGTGEALYVEGTADAYALRVKRNVAASVAILRIESGGANDRPHLEIAADGAGALARGISLVQVGPAIGCYIQQNGAKEALYVTSDQAQPTVYFEHTSFGAGNALEVFNPGTGKGLFVNQGGANNALHVQGAANSQCVFIDKQGVGAGVGLQVTNAGTAACVGISQVGNGIGLNVNKTGTGAGICVAIDNDGTSRAFDVIQDGSAVAAEITQNSANDVLILNKASSGAGVCLSVLNAGTGNGVLVDVSGNASYGLKVTHSGGTPTAGICNLDTGVNMGASTLVLVTGRHASHTGAVLALSSVGSGLYVSTDAGGTLGGTGAKLTNAGVWTNGTCLRSEKTDLQDLNGDAFLAGLLTMTFQRYTHISDKKDPGKIARSYVGCFLDDLIAQFGHPTGEGVSPLEVASIFGFCLQTLVRKLTAKGVL